MRLPLFAREWLLLASLAMGLAAWFTYGQVLQTPDRVVYDWVMRQNVRAADERIIVVAIDDKSLKALGRWPWARTTHARLLERLSAHTETGIAPPRAVFLDLLFAEPDAQHDRALIQAMQSLPKVVLPVAPEPFALNDQPATMLMPAKEFREVAYSGYSYLHADSDGLARRVALVGAGAVEGLPGQRSFEHTSLHMMGLASPDKTGHEMPKEAELLAGSMGISWVGPPGSFMTVPYVDVLNGHVPSSFFADRYVLIGATATGLGDRLATPTSATQGAMAGVEIQANILDGLLNQRQVQWAPQWQQALFTGVPILLVMLTYWLLAPRYAMVSTLGLLLLVTGVSVASLRWGDYWLSPSAACLTLIVVYWLWSWRRLEAVLRYFAGEIQGLEAERQSVPELAGAVPATKAVSPLFSWAWLLTGDTLEKQIAALHRGISRIRNLRQFLNDGLESLPVALFITDPQGKVLMCNHETRQLMASATQNSSGNLGLCTSIEQALLALAPQSQVLLGDAEPHSPKDYLVLDAKEIVTSQSLTLRLAVAPVVDADLAVPIGWLFALVDLSAERQIQAHRADLLRFLSHDLRTPQVSILAMLELQQDPQTALSPQELASRLGRQVRHTLRLTDDFLQLAKAEAQSDYKLAIVDLSDLALEAVDQVWPLAKQKRIALETVLPPLEALDEHGDSSSTTGTLVRADGDLLRRALVNLLHNAIRYSPPNTQVTVSVHGCDAQWPDKVRLGIQDQGIGIAAEDLPLIFERYRRLSRKSGAHPLAKPDAEGGRAPLPKEPAAVPGHDSHEVPEEPIQGLGLGLTQVKAVIDSHQGSIQCSSTPGQGTCFTIYLPQAKNIEV